LYASCFNIVLVLGGTSSYIGGTTVAAGTLVVEDAEALADGTSLAVGDASAFTSLTAGIR
jgi:autotransporter-associated beta strand protein